MDIEDFIIRDEDFSQYWVNDSKKFNKEYLKTIQNISFDDPDGLQYEIISFILEWDEKHSYDVEFENNKAIGLSVNG